MAKAVLTGLAVTSCPSPSPANKSPVCLPVTMETSPASAGHQAQLFAHGAVRLTLRGTGSHCPTFLPKDGNPRARAHPNPDTLAGLLLFGSQKATLGGHRRFPILVCIYEMGVQERTRTLNSGWTQPPGRCLWWTSHRLLPARALPDHRCAHMPCDCMSGGAWAHDPSCMQVPAGPAVTRSSSWLHAPVTLVSVPVWVSLGPALP